MLTVAGLSNSIPSISTIIPRDYCRAAYENHPSLQVYRIHSDPDHPPNMPIHAPPVAPNMFGRYRNFNAALNHVAPGEYIPYLRGLNARVKSLQEEVEQHPNISGNLLFRWRVHIQWGCVLHLERTIRDNRHGISAQTHADAAIMCISDIKLRLGEVGKWAPWIPRFVEEIQQFDLDGLLRALAEK